MWAWFDMQQLLTLSHWFGGAFTFFIANATTVLGLTLAVLIIRRVLSEKRTPSNSFAWFLIVIFFPLIGAVLYFMLGGRKSRKTTRIKLAITQAANSLAAETNDNRLSPQDSLAYEEGKTVTTGNHFELLPDGETAFQRFCEEIESAQHTIHIATYILSNDATGNQIVALLIKRAIEGVTVRLLLDSLGSWNQTRAARYKIRQAGGHVAMFMPVLPIQTHISSNLRNHRKIAIFDNIRAITGGQNLDIRFLGSAQTPDRFADFSVVTQGPAVAHINRIFLSDWAFAAKESPNKYRKIICQIPEQSGDSTLEVIASGPDSSTDPLWEKIIQIIQEFKRSLTIITPYFIPDEVLFQSLLVKAHTGRKIRLVLPLRSNHSIADIARYHYLRKLHTAGVEILFYTPRVLHGKLILADNKVALAGSANIDMRSMFVNFEIALLHYSPADISLLEEWACNIIEHCIPYETAITDKQLMPAKLTESLVHLFVPLL
jgi:cardiolipin synthase